MWPSGVNAISEFAFYGCTSMKSISIPNSVVTISSYAFAECSALTSVTIPSSVTALYRQNNADYSRAFFNCTNLANVCFLGNAPFDGGQVFDNDPVSIVYYINGTTGWNTTFSGVPTSACSTCFIPLQTGGIIQPVDLPSTTATNLALVIHGWTPLASSPYSDGVNMSDLAAAIQLRLQQDGQGQNWDVRFVDWGASSGGTPQGAVRNAVNIGAQTGQQIVTAGKYKKVLLVSHSAGAWMAQSIAEELIVNQSSGIQVSEAFLDPFVPGTMLPLLLQRSSDDIQYSPSGLGAGIPEAENYFYVPPTWPGLGNILPYAANYAIKGIQGCAGDKAWWDAHGWPVRWYKQTVDNPTWSLGFGLG